MRPSELGLAQGQFEAANDDTHTAQAMFLLRIATKRLRGKKTP